tara:strand:- start:473 stop:625 length:153 start_codon:yes stop_codon:yes gene_type:complete
MIGRIRPQIFLALVVLGSVSLYSIMLDHIEVASACVGGIVALGMKVMEGD